ncbi:MAG: hypothetical protein HY644_02290 [Acidobacteria bacterium]|nr:hypothetical protein [Acidobacteriota bacterium]
MRIARIFCLAALLVWAEIISGFCQSAKSIQPGDLFAISFGNEIWRLPANKRDGIGESFVLPPAGGALWGIAVDANRVLYYAYRINDNEFVARLNSDGASEVLGVISAQNAAVKFFLSDIIAGPTGNVYVAYRSRSSADCWIARFGPDKKVIDMQNGQEVTDAFRSTAIPVPFGSSLAVNSKDQIYFAAQPRLLQPPTVYRVPFGSPAVSVGTITNLRGIVFTDDDRFFGAQTTSTPGRINLLRINLPAAGKSEQPGERYQILGSEKITEQEGNGGLENPGDKKVGLTGQGIFIVVDPTDPVTGSTIPWRELESPFGGKSDANVAVAPGAPVFGPPFIDSSFDIYPVHEIFSEADYQKAVIEGLFENFAPDTAEPIISSIGEFVHDEIDLNLGGPLPLTFARHFGGLAGASAESRGIYPAADSPMGANWVHNFFILLKKVDSTNVIVHYLGGAHIYFRKSGAAWSMNQPGLSYKGTPYPLVESGSKLKMTDPWTRIIYTFEFAGMADGAVRAIESISDRNGNSHTLAYNPDSTLASVEDGLGRRLNFTYTTSAGKPRIVEVSDQTGRTIRFGHTEARLTSFTDARGKTTTYGMNARGQIESFTLPAGNTPVKNSYAADSDKVIAQTDGAGATTKIVYNTGNTVVTDPLGNTRTQHFDSQLRFARFSDEAGKTLQFGYDSSQRKTSTVDRLGDTSMVAYDAVSGKVTSRTDYAGQTWKYTYSPQSQDGFAFFVLSRIDYPNGKKDEFSYDARGNLVSLRDRAGHLWSYTYNDRGQVLTATNPEGGRTTFVYNPDGTLASRQDAAGNATQFGYDALKRLTSLTRPDGNRVEYTYDANDNLLALVNEKGKTTRYAYDDNNNLASLTDPLGGTWTFSYDGNDNLTEATDPLGKKMSFTYDALQRVKSAADRNGNTTQYAYDPRSRLVSRTDAAGKVWTFGYDDDNLPLSMTNPLGHTWRFSRDKVGRIASATDPLSNQTRLDYDVLSRLTAVTNPLSETASFAYDDRGQLNRASLPGPIAAAYARNALGRITQLTDPRGKARARNFDNLGRMISATDALGNVTRFGYDSRNRPSAIKLPLGTLSLAYDAVGLITDLSYSDGTRLEYRYDDNNRLTSGSGVSLEYDANGRVTASNGIAATRNAVGRIESLTLAPGKTVSYAYDSRNLLSTVTDWTGGVTRFAYDDAGRLASVSRPNGTTTTYAYDNAGRLTQKVEARASAGLSRIMLTRDGKGQTRRANRDVPLPPMVDPPDRNLAFNDADQISGFDSDALGRLTSDGTRAYTWDLASRLAAYTKGESTVEFGYDALGNRLTRTTEPRPSGSGQSTSRTFVWNYALALPSISIIKEDANPIRFYIHTPGGALMYSMEEVGNARRFYHYDEIGSTLFLTDDSGEITDRYAYSPYGQLVASSGDSDNPFTFVGRWGVMRESSGLYYMRARYYDGSSGRFLSRDPVGVSLGDPKSANPYQYGAQNPARYVDPLGLQVDTAPAPIPGLSDLIRDYLEVGFVGLSLRAKDSDPFYFDRWRGFGFTSIESTDKTARVVWPLELGDIAAEPLYAARLGVGATPDLRFTVEGLLIDQQCFARRGTSPGTCVSADFWDTFWIGATAGAKLAGIDLEGSFIYGQRRLWCPMWEDPKFEQPGFGINFTARLPLEPAPIWLFSDTVPPDRGKGSSWPPDTSIPPAPGADDNPVDQVM